MNASRYAKLGVLAAPAAGVAIGVWAEFADLGPPALLAVASPLILLSTLSAAYLRRVLDRPLPGVLAGAAIGLLTFSLSAGLHIAIHLLRGGGFDLNGASEGGSAGIFFGVHVVVGALVGVVLGAMVTGLVRAAKAFGWRSRAATRVDPVL